ncbi:hypothetical protein JG688_00013456 [Phytophthora aleatoria]|uniref:Uncharacterized protein n=1 Tax=Phytophthora aleatoria TaxID=2496075 RepID=A0A8J5IHL6_9STRA|nr:hypothetical protein JG688_00013456 [Phytophthora aleatoria]
MTTQVLKLSSTLTWSPIRTSRPSTRVNMEIQVVFPSQQRMCVPFWKVPQKSFNWIVPTRQIDKITSFCPCLRWTSLEMTSQFNTLCWQQMATGIWRSAWTILSAPTNTGGLLGSW